jgi:hypothetical protein
MGPSGGLDSVEERKIFFPCQESQPVEMWPTRGLVEIQNLEGQSKTTAWFVGFEHGAFALRRYRRSWRDGKGSGGA